MEGTVRRGGDVPQDPVVELLLVQGGLAVDHGAVGRALVPVGVGRRAEHQRAGQAEVGEEQLALVLIDDLALAVPQAQDHVPQGQALHPGAVAAVLLQGDERGARRHDGVPQRLRHAVAVAGRAGRGVGRPAGGQDHGPRRDDGPVGADDAAHAAVLHGDVVRAQVADRHPRPAQGEEQRVHHVGGAVRARKNAPPTLGLEGDAQLFKISHDRGGREAREGAVQKAPVAGDVREHARRVGVVGEVAAALAGDVELTTELFVRLEQDHLGPGPPRPQGGHHPGGAAADDRDRSVHWFSSSMLTKTPYSCQMCSSRSKWVTTSDLRRAIATRRALIRLSGATRESTKDAMSLLASRT